MEFRRSALAKRSAPDDLTAPVRLTPARSWIALTILGAIVAGGATWGFIGDFPVSARAPGVLSYLRGSFSVEAPGTGQVTRVVVAPGDELRPNGVVAELTVAGRSIEVRTAIGGRVAEVVALEGQFVSPGTVLSVVERSGRPDDRLVAVLYVATGTSVVLWPGMEVDLEVESAPSPLFGMLRGTVTEVRPVAEERRQIADFLGSDHLAGELVGTGTARRVVVDLVPRSGTASGFAWSRRDGPPFALASRTGVRGILHQPSVRPIDWVLP